MSSYNKQKKNVFFNLFFKSFEIIPKYLLLTKKKQIEQKKEQQK